MPKLLECRWNNPEKGFLPKDERWWELRSRMVTELVTDCGVYHYEGYAGLCTDFRSGGPLVDFVMPQAKNMAHIAALFLPHDLNYYGLVPRDEADSLLYQAMGLCRVAAWRKALVYQGVRIGGANAYSHLGDPLPPKYAANLGRFSFELRSTPALEHPCYRIKA